MRARKVLLSSFAVMLVVGPLHLTAAAGLEAAVPASA